MDPSTGRSPAPGLTLGHYRLIERIGAGGMGEVWRARDERLERDVALKLLLPGTLGDDAARKRFRREALSLSQLAHPNIATVFDFDTEAGLDFLVMEYVAGPAVTERLAQGPLPEAEVARLGVQLAEGLAAAHAQGIIHRDLKPGNVRLTPDGRLKILDFGLAKLVRPLEGRSLAESLTEAQALVGTLAYMAPEQVRGEPADARSDLWAAGLVLYELATGAPAYAEARSAQMLYAILNQTPAAPRSLSHHMSAGLEAIILKCLEKVPGRRYQAATELAADLTRLLGGLTVEAERQRVRSHRARTLGIAVPVAIVLVLAVLTAMNVGGLRSRLFAPAPIRSIAVLPLANLSGDPDQEYFADGMTEALINDLGKVSALRVISRTSAMQYKGAKKGLPQIARELHVDAIVEGSVVRSGERVKISAQLIRAKGERQLWADAFERDLRDVLILQGEMAGTIAGAVRAKLKPEERKRLAGARPVNPEAYQLCLKGNQLVTLFTQESFRHAIEAYQQAIAIDSSAAYAYAGLSTAYNFASLASLAPAKELMPKARAAAMRALELDGGLAEAHGALCGVLLYEWDWAGADRESRRALELNPNSVGAIASRGTFLYYVGRYEDAAAQFRRLRQLSPASYWDILQAGWGLHYARRFDEAIATFDQARQLNPNDPISWMERGAALSMAGRHHEAVAECREAVRRAPDVDYLLASCGSVFARAGERRDAADALDALRAIARRQPEDPFNFAWFYSGAGPNDSTLFWLERAVEERSAGIPAAKAEFWPASLRADPRFKDLLKRMGLPPD